jgi:hypothetical protein
VGGPQRLRRPARLGPPARLIAELKATLGRQFADRAADRLVVAAQDLQRVADLVELLGVDLEQGRVEVQGGLASDLLSSP